MRRRELDEEAVSSSVATVLLFAGVLAIISGMMVTITPVIDEMHGAVERESMSGQLGDFSTETQLLSESGIPGDTSELSLNPHTGNLAWDLMRGGTWYTATYQPDSEFRIEGVLDLDDEMKFRYANSRVESLCATNLHASTESEHHYRVPALNGTIGITSLNSLSTPLGPTILSVEQGEIKTQYSVEMGSSLEIDVNSGDGESWIHSENPLRVVFWRGTGGVFIAPPDLVTPKTDEGRSWTIPLTEGDYQLHAISSNPFTLQWSIGDTSGNGVSSPVEYAQESSESDSTHIWNGVITATEAERFTLQTSANTKLVLRWGDSAELDGEGPGAVHYPDQNGAWTGVLFRPPAMNGTLIMHNPSDASTTAKINDVYHSIGAYSTIRIPWNTESLSWIDANTPITLEWALDSQTIGNSATHANGWRQGSMSLVPATDTGRSTGQSWSFQTPSNAGSPTIPSIGDIDLVLQPAAPSVSWSTSVDTGDPNNDSFGHLSHDESKILHLTDTHGDTVQIEATNGPIRLWAIAGSDGAASIPEDGADRCVNIDMRASGWMDVNLPWAPIEQLSTQDIRASWKDGSHFFGVSLTIRGAVDGQPHVALGSAWALNLPRLSYTFDSSVSGLEIVTHGGFVGTNHPEFRPSVLVEPPSRVGPGPRLAVTVPVVLPTFDSVSGSSTITMSLSLDYREQLSSITAHQVRRGWDGPYANVIAAESASGTDFSGDWLAFPGQLDMLNDYVGWVQTSPSMPEVVYHAGGNPVLFNIQVAQINSHTTRGALS